jgi:isopentenyl-diphosphate delta-isomerase
MIASLRGKRYTQRIPTLSLRTGMPKRISAEATVSRKKQHVELALSRNVLFRRKGNGLDRWEFEHNALPELDVEQIDPSTEFLGKTLNIPFMISSMTGGYADARRINRHLAEACEQFGIAMGVGSQRQALEESRFHSTFSIVREAAPTIPVIGNIGGAEVASLKSADPVRRLAALVKADAFAVHLNPLQEFPQPEGSPRFRGVLDGIRLLVRDLEIPLIVKEVGAGLSAEVIGRLLEAGVRTIDVAGAGGTSWAGVEILRQRGGKDASLPFWDWGIPTSVAVAEAAALKGRPHRFFLIASGGISTGLEAAKCIALGADLAASARPMLKALARGGPRALQKLLDAWSFQLRGAMFCTGSRTIGDLQHAHLRQLGQP